MRRFGKSLDLVSLAVHVVERSRFTLVFFVPYVFVAVLDDRSIILLLNLTVSIQLFPLTIKNFVII
jgi:hypothetical protein